MDFPPEILDRIFGMNEFKSFCQRHLGDSSVQRVHVPLIRVCRSWRPVAERRLYRAIPLFRRGYGRSGPLPATYVEKRHLRLCRTLQGNASLAAHVRELYLDLDACENEKARVYLKIVNLCPNLSHLTIERYKAYDLVRLKRVLAAKNLVRLTISADDEGPVKPLLSSKELLQMMTMWPMIEKIYLNPEVLVSSDGRRNKSHSSTSDQQPAEMGFVRTSCPELRDLTLEYALLSARDLGGLLVIALPRLKSFSARVARNTDTQVALVACLKAWSPHLVDLSIDHDFKHDAGLRPCTRMPIDDAVVHLSSLRSLSVSALLVRPQTILTLSALKYIDYYIPTAEDLDVLTLGLTVSEAESARQVERRLPALSSLRIAFSMEEKDHRSDELRAAKIRLRTESLSQCPHVLPGL